ncbi:S-adenosylmethionine carrier 1 chloroplastic/mitochondrial [Tripterygium wilfordii]|uniref:S-adenosylmethionine carrier 1 chloroplastic/mitochondrial n=2 Tax=Tripterygium wilfordii TaxID=458696 RepID=A0A7J7DGK8_TRIWF|nr:S-adenosylmethionine carrier 1, chloroplastic/mitochondrial isoform X2 [Tripterygium wilfordii]KAF5745186.1 S-adenosylmethionine carrier 1 chloroplastic/mitochondrial [Tripterygium wilfordii]
MGPLTLAADAKSSPVASPDASCRAMPMVRLEPKKSFASIGMGEENPFEFLRTLWEGAIAGGTAGVVVETALYPIDTIKTRLQAARGGGKIILKGLYSGLAGNLAGVLPASAVFVGVYEPSKQKLLKILPENLSAVAHLTAGALGGLAASLIRVPTEVVKQRMQTGQFTSAPDAVRLIISKEGYKGLYAGYGSFLLRDLPFDAIQFCIYEQLRIGYKSVAKRDLNDPENAAIGAFSGALTGAITTPLDVIKTRLMVQGSGNQYKGIVDCVQGIIREEGPSALLKGIGPRVLWIGIGGSIFFGVLERTKRLLEQRRSTSKKPSDFKQD